MPADLINYGTKASDHVGCDKQNLVCASYELGSEETFTVCVKLSRGWPVHVCWRLETADIWWNCSPQLLLDWHLLALKFISRNWDTCVRHASRVRGIFANCEEVAGGMEADTRSLQAAASCYEGGWGGGRDTFFPPVPEVRLGDSKIKRLVFKHGSDWHFNLTHKLLHLPRKQALKPPEGYWLRPVWLTFLRDNNTILTCGSCEVCFHTRWQNSFNFILGTLGNAKKWALKSLEVNSWKL